MDKYSSKTSMMSKIIFRKDDERLGWASRAPSEKLRALVSYPRHLRGVETVERGERWREFTEFQAQKKTSEDVFFLFGGPG
jgi:hypothetical protein